MSETRTSDEEMKTVNKYACLKKKYYKLKQELKRLQCFITIKRVQYYAGLEVFK